MNKEERNSFRKEMLGKLEEQWAKSNSPEDDLFYYHPSEDKIVLSHALFWVMTQNIKGKVGKEKYLLLLRQYQEEMLEAWLTESSDFKDLLHYCNVIYNTLPMILRGVYNFSIDKDARRLGAICVVAGGYGGDMKRFPDYYMFRLTEEEWNNWKSQFVTSNYMSEDEIQAIKMGVRRPPFAFTEQGVSQF